MRRISLFVLVVVVSGLIGCSGGSQTLPANTTTPGAPLGLVAPQDLRIQYATTFPDALPQDAIQPWEQLGIDGKVVSATSASTEFLVGQQTHLESGDTSDWNGALRLASGGVGEGNLSFAMYRIPLGGSEPGVVSVDANLRPMDDGKVGEYWVGLADYAIEGWQWFGPVTDAHWRVSIAQVASEDAWYTSDLGSVFVCVVANDGVVVDIVGVGVDPEDPADETEPDAPDWLDLEPVAGGLELDWGLVDGSDLAGYKVYYNEKAFGEYTAEFAHTLPCLQGRDFILGLPGVPTQEWWVAVSAVDLSGNESELSEILHATPLEGAPPVLDLEVSTYSTQKGLRAILTATGADYYDWDLDGDGVFDILDDESGTADADTSNTGLIRPLVQGYDEAGTSVAQSAVSVIVSSNSRPVAVASASPASGSAPLEVDFSGTESTDFDGTVVGGGWDFDGDGIYDVWSDTELVHITAAQHTYDDAGLFNAKLRVVDDAGAWDVDTVAIQVLPPGTPENLSPTASLNAAPDNGDAPLTVLLDASGSTDPDGTIVKYEWDFNGDEIFDGYSSQSVAEYTYGVGSYSPLVRVTDNRGAQSTTMVFVSANVPGNTPPVAALSVDHSTANTSQEVTFDASSSTDGDGSIVLFEWDFDGDGNFDSSGSSSTATHIYGVQSGYDAWVRVTDNQGGSDTTSIQVAVTHGPWSTRGHDTLHRGRSPNIGPQTNNLQWTYTTGDDIYSSPAIGFDGTIYIGSLDDKLHAINPDGSPKWSFTTGGDVVSSPALGADGTVYIGSNDNKIYALNADGSLKWSFSTANPVHSSPIIDSDGTVYIGSLDNKMYALNPDGSLKWFYLAGGTISSSPAISTDGTIYFGSDDNKINALNNDGSLKWSFPTGSFVASSPAVGEDGTVYVGCFDDKLYAINPDGTFKWSYTPGGSGLLSSPAIGSDGVVYIGNRDFFLYAVNPDGSFRWSFETDFMVETSPVIGADGLVYFGNTWTNLYALNPNGTEKWSYNLPDTITSSAAIGANGTVYVGCYDNKLYAFGP